MFTPGITIRIHGIVPAACLLASTGQADVNAQEIKPVDGLAHHVHAEHPMVKDPVAFCFDERGRIYVAETFRQDRGVEDNRSSAFWLLDDLSLQTVEDRLRMYEKWAHMREGGMAYYSTHEDRITRLVDTDSDGVADAVTIFADGFNEPLDGTGAGVLVIDGDLWYTNIPHLWRLRDHDDDGVADVREQVYSGFGVRIALRGHDMHGLVLGPDGRLYFSIGDRGYHVINENGRLMHDPRSGAVFRCELDGTDLELVHTGLRNPQELAFDAHGNLFTGDNNSDGGDRARIVHIVDGGQTGWEMNYQTLEGTNQRGPWNQEGIWHLRHEAQPAWSLPPVDHIGSGPSGLTYYPGLGLPSRYDDHFFLCDFRGSVPASSVLSFALEPDGAGFRMVDLHPIVSNVLATDVEFGYDNRMYIADWVKGWNSTETGRIHVVHDPEFDPGSGSPTSTSDLFRNGFDSRSTGELLQLLAHPDMRVRLRSQFELAGRGDEATLELQDLAAYSIETMPRLHAIWALGMQARNFDGEPDDPDHPLLVIDPLLEDPDPRIREQAAMVIGDSGYQPAAESLVPMLEDPEPRARYFAAMSLGRLSHVPAVAPIIEMARNNAGEDLYLRHAAVMALHRMNDREILLEWSADPDPEIRLVTLLAMRRQGDREIARFLFDQDDRLVLEAARAICDVPIPEAMPALAASIERFIDQDDRSDQQPTEHVFDIEYYENISPGRGTPLREALANRESPDETHQSGVASTSSDRGDQYVSRIIGTIVPTQTGEHVFYLCSDDHSELYLPHFDPVTPIATVDDWVVPGRWSQEPAQVSPPIHLVQGREYMIESIHSEGGGGDHHAIGWRLPDGTFQGPIGSTTGSSKLDPFLRRAIEANLQDHSIDGPSRLIGFVQTSGNSSPMKLEALENLASWFEPGPRNSVNGRYRVIDGSGRDVEAYRRLLQQHIPTLAESGDPAVRSRALAIASELDIAIDDSVNLQILADPAESPHDRSAALVQLVRSSHEDLPMLLDQALASDAPLLRSRARTLQVQLDPTTAVNDLVAASVSGTLLERQYAVRDLGSIEDFRAVEHLVELMDRLADDRLEPGLQLDVLDAARGSNEPRLAAAITGWERSLDPADPLAHHEVSLEGGDPERGRWLVHYHATATCLRCHVIEGVGGEAGPALDGVGSRLDRRQLLESMIVPEAVIVEGFGDESAMPGMGQLLTPMELRDIIEYLQALQD